MTKGKSRFVPQHRYWYEDLPERDAPPDRAPKMVHGDVNAMDDVCLEVSRASTLMRGAALFFGSVGGLFLPVGILFFGFLLFDDDISLDDRIFLIPAFLVALAALGWGVILSLKVDLLIPRDRPIRFSRARRKVYVYEHAYGMNPFVKWPTTVKEFDWGTLHAEVHRHAGFNGKAYIQRFAVWLVSCKPGTNEVVDRFELKGNIPTTEELYNAWAYCRQYMEHGARNLPVYAPRRQEISFRRSLFEYMRFLDPTEEGREVRQRMTAGDWAFNVPFIALTFWIFIPIGIGHYIAMRFAPEAKWPPKVDAESKSA